MLIGIDIGGTHTDGVLVDARANIIEAVKVTTTQSPEQGFEQVIAKLCNDQVRAILVGTTHATNALLQRQDLYKVGVLRIAGHNPITLPPCFGWPQDLKDAILADTITINGGFECDGRPLTPLSTKEIEKAIQRLADMGAESIAVVGVFSPLYPQQEQEVVSHLPITLSHELGGLGWIERENAAILNAALKKVMRTGFQKLAQACSRYTKAPLYLTQNNGTLITLEEALNKPILTLSAGPTNSFVGGAKLAKVSDAIVVDVGGTSTDVGIIHNGFPRRCLHASHIGGVSLSFAMPDVLSIALGGGSHVDLNTMSIGPKSSAKNLLREALSFGGEQLTFTDLCLALGHISIPSAKAIKIDFEAAFKLILNGCEQIQALVQRIEADKKGLPIILVGGGASLLPHISTRYICPSHAPVANAYGAALAEIAATTDLTISLSEREKKLEEIKELTLLEARKKGADKPRIINQEILPYHYMPGHKARIITTASGIMI